MGIIYDILSAFTDDPLLPAMEADDITGDAKREASDMSGDKSDSGEISLNTDNIFGDDNSNSQDTGEANDNADDSDNMDDMDSGDETEDAGDSDDMSEGEDDFNENDVNSEANTQDELLKKKAKEQMIHLYDVIMDDIKLISEYIPNITTAETAIALGNIKRNLVQCKEYLHDILHEEYATLEYPILRKKLVALQEVYDLSVRAIDKYFKENGESEKS